MREVVKSTSSLMLALSLFGLKQLDNLMKPRGRGDWRAPATKAADAVTSAAIDQFGESLRSTFRAVDNAQRGIINLWFSLCMPFATGDSERTSEPDDDDTSWSEGEPRRWTEVMDEGVGSSRKSSESDIVVDLAYDS